MGKTGKRRLNKYKLYTLVLLVAAVILSCTVAIMKKSNSGNDKKINRQKNELTKIKSENESLKSEIDKTVADKKELESSLEEESKANDSLSSQIDKLVNAETKAPDESAYASIHPEIAVDSSSEAHNQKIVYLTFDDGPSDLTPEFLKVLKDKGVNATFFVTYQPDKEAIYKQIIEQGNKIQIHTATHDYNNIYASVENYLEDFAQVYNYVYQVTGVKPDAFRFPGGSTNSYGKSIVRQIAKELKRRGFDFYDWNVSVGDGSASATKDSIIAKIQSESDGKNRIVMLAHDSGTKSETLAALPEIIEYYKSNGYTFGVIDGNIDAGFAQFIEY